MFWKLRRKDYKAPKTSSRGNHLPLILAQIGQKLAVASIEGVNKFSLDWLVLGFSHRAR